MMHARDRSSFQRFSRLTVCDSIDFSSPPLGYRFIVRVYTENRRVIVGNCVYDGYRFSKCFFHENSDAYRLTTCFNFNGTLDGDGDGGWKENGTTRMFSNGS